MTGFWFHHFWLRRLYIKGRGPRAMRARLGRERKVNRRVMQSLIASRVAAAEMEEQIRRIRQVMELQFQANILDDLWVLDCLFEVENDPRIRNILGLNRARTFTGPRRRPGPP
ncbi:uncharacterized protein LOC120206967 [Hibiscus syriacus]|uniref:uncharacterized protein LOC120206967 n=1 Tax=Hibiscus syriacus TaxID=106335 RepID=UPI001924562D|nr:uncharacterized protein LOC120206967 [Hibiscus syriacus]